MILFSRPAPIHKLYEPLLNSFNGNAENFYSEFYKLSWENVIFKDFLNKELLMLLCCEISAICLEYLTERNRLPCRDIITEDRIFTEKDIQCLQYLADYCFHNLFLKFRRKTLHDNESAQQWLAILLAAKSDKEQSLVDTKNRGGLWKVNEKAVNIFMACEREFCFSVQECTINKIDAQVMVEV